MKPAVAQKLLEISNEWYGKAVDAEILRRVADAHADSDTILTLLARHRELRENLPSELFELMKTAVYPKGVSDEEFKKLLYAIQHAERHLAKESKSGRRSRFDATFLFNSSLKIKIVLQNETGGRISLMRFTTTYLSIPNYSPDIQKSLDSYRINLEEARILTRINRTALGAAVKRKPSEIRKEIIDSHLKRQGTQAELKKRVDERLNTTPKKQAQNVAANVAVLNANFDELLEFNEFDTEHLLWEEIKGLVYLMREVDSAAVDDETTEQVLKELDSIKLRLLKFRKTVAPSDFHSKV